MMRNQIRLSALMALCIAFLAVSIPLAAAGVPAVKAWETTIVIPTYLAGDPEPNPMFYFGRSSQGAQAPVYPYPMYDVLTGKKADKTYKIVYLENEYLRIGILPEIGGRIFEGLDKTNNYNFIYRQHVIKPTLISIIGAWVSGGVEWNINHHHRATTFPRWKRTRTAARLSGLASWKCASACGGRSATPSGRAKPTWRRRCESSTALRK